MKKLQNFYVRSSLFVGLSIAGAVINYLLYPILSRVLNLQEFGDFVAVIGLSNQVMGILLAFLVISIALVKQYGEDEAQEKTQIIQKMLIWLFLVASIGVLLVSPFLLNLLHIQYALSFFVLSLIMILAVPVNIWSGYLQGHKEQIRVGIFTVCSAALKLVLIVLLAMYYGVGGGLWGFFLGSLLGLVVLYYLPGKRVPKLDRIFSKLKDGEKQFLAQYKGYIFQSILVVAGLVFLQNYDLNRAKALFDPGVAGIYGGISVLSNALYYVSFLLVWVLLPEFNTKDPSVNRRVLKTAYRLIGALAVVVVAGGLTLGDTALKLLLGESFAGQSHTLVVASLYQISLVAVVLYAFYLLVMRQRRSILLALSVLLCCGIIPLFFTKTPFEMITSLWLSVLAGVAVYWITFRVILRRSIGKAQ